GPEMEMLRRGQLTQRVTSPLLAELIAAAIRPHGEWVGTRLNVFALAYNTRLVRKQDLPKSYEDLAHPRWKGKLGIEADDADWLAGVFAQFGEARGVRIFREIVAANGISVRRGHTLLTQLVVSGEVPLAPTVYHYKAEQRKGQGAPIEWLWIGSAVARATRVAVDSERPPAHT